MKTCRDPSRRSLVGMRTSSGRTDRDNYLCNPVCPFEIFLECLILQADYEEQLVVVFCQYQASFQLLAMTEMMNLHIKLTR